MREASPLNVSDIIQVGTYVGHEGMTGNASGIHLHLASQDLTNHDWLFGVSIDNYLNPALILGIPNQLGISAIYYRIPPTPPITIERKKFPWVLYSQKLRNRHKF